MNTKTTATDVAVQQDSEPSMSAREAGISGFLVSEISVQEQLARVANAMWQKRDRQMETS